jgi:predicted ribosomally synthesized peptide with nif11-like leader
MPCRIGLLSFRSSVAVEEGDSMSKKQAQQFIEKLQKSVALRKKVNEASGQIVKVARDNGYKVTREEISLALREHWCKEGKGKKDILSRVLSEAPGS